jgi:hypothetical protein
VLQYCVLVEKDACVQDGQRLRRDHLICNIFGLVEEVVSLPSVQNLWRRSMRQGRRG